MLPIFQLVLWITNRVRLGRRFSWWVALFPKGFEFGLRALAKLAANGLDFKLEVLGDGPLRESLVKLSKSFGFR